MKHKKLLIGGITAAVLVILVFSVTYTTGMAVIEDPVIQWVSHTEYWSGDTASTIVRVADYRGEPYTIDSCSVTILYPDKTAFVTNSPMSRSGVEGNWYATHIAPNQMGTYEQEVTCVSGGNIIKTSESFHVNPALEKIKTLDENLIALDTSLTGVDLELKTKIDNGVSQLDARIDTAETNLDTLVKSVKQELNDKLDSVNGDTDTRITNAKISIEGKIAGTGETITTRVDLAETNLNALVNSVQTTLQNDLASKHAATDAKITDVKTTLTGQLTGLEAALTAKISTAETNLNTAMNSVKDSLAAQLTDNNLDISALDQKLTNVDISLTAKVAGTENEIKTSITNTEGTLSALTTTLASDIKDYLVAYLPSIKDATANIYTDTQWLVTNAMNDVDKADLEGRLDTIDANIALIENYCGNVLTDASALCTEVDALKTALNIIRAEQTDYFEILDATTTNTWNLLSGDIASGINTALSDLGIIKTQTSEIKATVQSIKDVQESEINIRVIS